MILFLDFDGVLHGEPELRRCAPTSAKFLKDDEKRFVTKGHQRVVSVDGPLFEHAERLAEVLAGHESVDIVISSSWRTHFDLHKLAGFLPPALGHRVVGTTPVLDASNPDGIRFLECESWVMMRGLASCPWLALDDMAELFFASPRTPAPPNLVWCRDGFFNDRAAAELRVKIAALAEAGDRWREALAVAHREMGEK